MARDRTILSIDLGLSTGWCRLRNGVIEQSGVIQLARKDAHPGDRFLRFHNWLAQHKDVQEIYYEDVPRLESNKSARTYCGFLALVQMFCLTRSIRMTCIKANTVKKEFTGNGRAEKSEMCRVAHRLGWPHGHPDTDLDHDEADAIATAFVIEKRCGREPQLQIRG